MTASPALPEGEHPDPFVVAEEYRDELQRKYPVATHTPWFDLDPPRPEQAVSPPEPALW